MDKVRRKEYKKRRWYKRRERRRHPLGRLFKTLYADMRGLMFPVVTPFFSMLRTAGGSERRWGTNAVYFDVLTDIPEGRSQTTRATTPKEVGHSRGSRTAVPVNYNDRPRGPFYRNPFIADA